jgi:hypothetical protein
MLTPTVTETARLSAHRHGAHTINRPDASGTLTTPSGSPRRA